MGELEAILIPCLLGWCQTYVDTIIGGWFPGPARAGPAVWPHPVHAGSWGEARMMQAVGPHYVSPSLPCDSWVFLFLTFHKKLFLLLYYFGCNCKDNLLLLKTIKYTKVWRKLKPPIIFISPIFLIYIVNYFTLYNQSEFFFFFCFRLSITSFSLNTAFIRGMSITSCSVTFIHSKVFLSGCYVDTMLLAEDKRLSKTDKMELPEWSLRGDSQKAHTRVRCEKCHEWRDGGWLGKAWSGKASPRRWRLSPDLNDENEPVMWRLREVIF